ncbi:MAG: hypothetical protein K0R14_1570 [Burkholderiales bacterium]|nr:hypothetical protein [Burkholderiales bacterium]
MCMRRGFLCWGEKIFNVLVILGFIAGAVSGISTGMAIGGKQGWTTGGMQVLLSWSGTLIISLVVYSLLDIKHSVSKDEVSCTK